MTKTTVLGIRLTDEERAICDREAGYKNMTTAQWAKNRLLAGLGGVNRGTLKKGAAVGRGRAEAPPLAGNLWARKVDRAAPRPPRSQDVDVKPSECKHPLTRRTKDGQCYECGAAVGKK